MDYLRLTPILAPAVATQEATDGDSSWLPRQAFNATAVAIRAPAVATKEATDGDGSWLPRQAFNATAVAIRKARKLANGWRYLLAPRRGGLAREAVLCAGELPVGTVLARMLPTCRKRLEQHAAAEAASR